MVEIYNGSTIETDNFLEQLIEVSTPRELPFSDTAIEVLSALSKACLTSPLRNDAPQLVALGFWLRKANLIALQEEFAAKNDIGKTSNAESIAVARGLVFHLPPSNVDTLFIYSWALSFLAGNANVVRLPTKINVVGRWILDALHEILKTNNLSPSNIFTHFSHSENLNADISVLCNLRMIWGGDDKVRTVAKHPVQLDGISLGFPNRKSFTIIRLSYFQDLDDESREKLCEKFYNDIFWFDQLGCGSPRAVVWYDTENSSNKLKIVDEFYMRLNTIIKKKAYKVEDATTISKFGFLNSSVVSTKNASANIYSNELFTLTREKISDDILDDFHGGGFLSQVFCSSISQTAPLFNRAVQTITHAGLTMEDLKVLVDISSGNGGYRFVPVGKALNFQNVWDGVDLLQHMTRTIVLETR